jgi:hypothetical protein
LILKETERFFERLGSSFLTSIRGDKLMPSKIQDETLLWQRDWYKRPIELEDDLSGNPEAEVPVPDRLFPKRISRALLLRLKLSQKIGLLLWMNRNEVLSLGGEEQLLYLQKKASFEAISSGLKFADRLNKEKKLQSDFLPHMIELNRRPQSKRFRKFEKNRIGIGYRDKGTTPENSSFGRTQAQKESWILLSSLPENLIPIIQSCVPQLIEGEWLDLGELSDYFDNLKELRDQLLLNQL